MNNLDLVFSNSSLSYLYNNNLDSVDAAPIAFAPSPSVSESFVKSKIKRWSAAETAKLKEIIETVSTNWKEVANRMQQFGSQRTIEAYSRKYRELRSQKLLNEANKDLTKAPTEERVKHVKDQVSVVTSLTTESSEIIISPSSPSNSSIISSSSSTDTSLLSLLDDSWISTLPVMPFSATISHIDSSEVVIDPSSPGSSSISSSSSSTDTSLSNLDDSWTLGLPMMTSSNTTMFAKPVPSRIVRKKWTELDDQRLLDIVNSFKSEAINWQTVAKKVKKYNNVRCRERYFEVLDPTINKTPLSIDEMNGIISLVNKIGTKWSEIARKFPGRTPGKIKHFWYSKIRSELEKDSVSSKSTSLQSSSSVKRKLPVELTEQSKKGKSIGDISTANNLGLVAEGASSNFLLGAPWNLRTDTNVALT